MTKDGIDKLLKQGEGIEIEFKECLFELNKDTFDSICAFLNRNGGHLLLGVTNAGVIQGVLEDSIQNIIHNLVTSLNNPGKLNPPFYIAPQVIEYSNDKKIIYMYIPEGSQVYRTNNKIFDRNDDDDINITENQDLVTQLYLRKRESYSENKIYPLVQLQDFKLDLLNRVRSMVRAQRANHPWLELGDLELLKAASLHIRDFRTGEEGFTLAAVLLFGKDEVIQSILPHYKTDAIVQIDNVDRYDDRDVVKTNLIEAYDRLMDFIKKHLPDKFYQLNTQRISLRDNLFREIVANLLVHREFTSAFPAKLIISQDEVLAENWNKPHGNGAIDPNMLSPFPKNPNIANFFAQLGRVEELGSGIRNVFKYSKLLSGKEPRFENEDIFQAWIPIYRPVQGMQVSNKGSSNVKGTLTTYLERTLERAFKGTLERTLEIVQDALDGTLERVQDALDGTLDSALEESLLRIYNQVVSNVKDTDSQDIRIRLVKELILLKHARELRGESIQAHFKIGRTAYQKDMKRLRVAGWIEFIGRSYHGKYILTDKGQQLLKEIPDVNESANQ